MRRRPFMWLLISLACFLGALYFWRLGDQWRAKKLPSTTPATTSSERPQSAAREHRIIPARSAQFNPVTGSASTNLHPGAFEYRLSNSQKTLRELAQSDQAILLENALIDTTQPLTFSIPDKLRAQGDPGSYIVQSHGVIDDEFRAALRHAGAEIVAYVPNNAYLVRASAEAASQLSANPRAQAIYEYEPYYKLSRSLLQQVLEEQPFRGRLNVLVFPGALDDTLPALGNLGQVLGEAGSPFGQVIKLEAEDIAAIAGLPGVQRVEIAARRVTANDISRERLAVAENSQAIANYLDLSGSNVIVQIVDSGVDTNHPDLAGRVFGEVPAAFIDTIGHGTHVAGSIAGNGLQSYTVSNAVGSELPYGTNQFRGMAPAARLYALPFEFYSDYVMQQAAARTNALISNNSWNYEGVADYDIAAASYDAAVRDALPEIIGSQPVAFVFPSANQGNGPKSAGNGGNADSILSPATAKNVITVGAIENARGIDLAVHKPDREAPGTTNTVTEFPWLGETDTDNQVASFSSRGNVGVGAEGDFGRFKPDVVAPGTMIISTRSTMWDTNAYYNPTNYDTVVWPGLLLDTNMMWDDFAFTYRDTVQVWIDVYGVLPFVDMPIYVSHTTWTTFNQFDFIKTNSVRIPPDETLTGMDDTWFYGVANVSTERVRFNVQVTLVNTNDFGDQLDVLRTNLNDPLGPFYRYESGTSMAAGQVSGVLALIQDFFTNRMGRVASPALLKALLINGARPLNNTLYNFQVNSFINYQGWGLVNLPTSLPETLTAFTNNTTPVNAPMYFFEQSPTNALATGQSQTRYFQLSDDGRSHPLRITLVWSDPPGNPSVGIKLVNDLNLVVTNLQNGRVYFGNDILAGNYFNLPWNTNDLPNRDFINNVENVYLDAPLGSNYSVSVLGHRVNVNAVTAHTNDVAQDYALVVSSGDVQFPDALSLTQSLVATNAQITLTTMTNAFGTNTPGIAGQILLEQRLGAQPPILGTNSIPLGPNPNWGTEGEIRPGVKGQWHFYTITNETSFTNALFATFLPPNLSPSRMGVTNVDDTAQATRVSGDIDLYVNTDSGLLSVDPAAIAAADKSLGRGGTEFVVYTNSEQGRVYYIGVKSEDQQAAEYALVGLFSELPFNEANSNGLFVAGLPVPQEIPDAVLTGSSTVQPGVAIVLGVVYTPTSIRRVIVSETLHHELIGDLVGTLQVNDATTVALNNNKCVTDPATGECFTNFAYVFDDSGESSIPGARFTDGPGSLTDFIGQEAVGVWTFTMVDAAIAHSGRILDWSMQIEPLFPAGGLDVPARSLTFFGVVEVPPEATNLIVNVSGNTEDVILLVRRSDFPAVLLDENGENETFVTDYLQRIPAPGGSLSINRISFPPLQPGRYYVSVWNPSHTTDQHVIVSYELELSLEPIEPIVFGSSSPIPILDDAISYSTNIVPDLPSEVEIARVDVGVALSHPRVSDLALTLISPQGKRFLLFENRGGPDAHDMGNVTTTTNLATVVSGGSGPDGVTNSYGPVPPQGIVLVDYNYFSMPDSIDVYYDGANIFSRSNVSGAGQFVISYGPGNTNQIVIVMNQNGNPSPSTIWTNAVSIVDQVASYLTFTDNTNYADIPIKFAIPPYYASGSTTNFVLSNFEPPTTNGTYPVGSIVDGWTVANGPVAVTSAAPPGAANGSQYLRLLNGTIGRALPTRGGNEYSLSFAYNGLGSANVQIPGLFSTNIFHSLSGGWLTNTINFRTAVSGTPIFIQTLSGGMLLDYFTLTETNSGNLYYFPEVPLQPLLGEKPEGNWTLEVRDARAGEFGGGLSSLLVNWQLQFIFATNYAQLVRPPDGGEITGTIVGCGITNFIIDVPPEARYATNILITATGPVNMWYNTNQLPTGTNLTDFEMIANATSGSYTLFDDGIPQLHPGTFYFLGVENTNCATNVTFTIRVDLGLDIITLTNHVPYTNSNSGTNLVTDYYHFFIPPEAARAQFEIVNPSGDMALVARHGLPLPTLTGYDVISDNPGTNSELIVLTTNSTPVALTPGNWYLGAINRSGQPVTYSIIAHWWDVTGLPVNILDAFFSGTNTFCMTWESLPGVHYFIQGVTNLTDSNWTTVTPVGMTSPEIVAVDTNTTACIDLGLGYQFFRVGEGLVLSAYQEPVAVTNGIAVTNVIPPCQFFYYTVDVPLNAAAVTNTIVSASTPVNVWFSQTAFPTGTNAGDVLLLANAASGASVVLTTNSNPTLVPGTTYYIGIQNPCANSANATVVFRIDLGVDIITLQNGVAYSTLNMGGIDGTNYFRYVVSPSASRVQFEINHPGGDVTLLARRGLPLPTFANYDYISANPTMNDELIVILPDSSPMLMSGEWYLAVINVSGGQIPYDIKATEWVSTGSPIEVTGVNLAANTLCVTWTSLPGVHYYVQGVTNLTSTNWVTLSTNIVATGSSTTWCMDRPLLPSYFLRVVEGLGPPATPIVTTTIAGGIVTLQWAGPALENYDVEWADPFVQTLVWTSTGGIINYANGLFTFSEPATQPGRLYRVVKLP